MRTVVILALGLAGLIGVFLYSAVVGDDPEREAIVQKVVVAVVVVVGAVRWLREGQRQPRTNCDDDWHLMESVLEPECPSCRGTWKHSNEPRMPRWF